MATVQSGHSVGHSNGHQGGQVVRGSTHDAHDIHEMQRDARARDDIKGAFAGNENEAKFKREDHPTKLKSRKTKKSAERTPKI